MVESDEHRSEAIEAACRSAVDALDSLSEHAWDFGATYLAMSLTELSNRLGDALAAHDAGPGGGEGTP